MDNVKVVWLGRIRVASVLGYGIYPEEIAWRKLKAWAEPRGLLKDLDEHPIYGFNNPNPAVDKEEYGYELWIVVGQDVESDDHVMVKEFGGGYYAVRRHYWTSDPGMDVPTSWMKLNDWLRNSGFQTGAASVAGEVV